MQAKIVFVSILVLATFNLLPFSVYSKPLSLQISDEDKIGFEVLYNQREYETLKFGEDAMDYTTHLGISFNLTKLERLILIPCFVYKVRKDPSDKDLNFDGCYARYSRIVDISSYVNPHIDNLSIFYRIGGGYGKTDALEKTESQDNSYQVQTHSGVGLSYNIWRFKLFAGLFTQNIFYWRSQENDSRYDVSSELGIDLELWDNISASITYSPYLVNRHNYTEPPRKFYFGIRLR